MSKGLSYWLGKLADFAVFYKISKKSKKIKKIFKNLLTNAF
jgi:hypothetical protein